MSGEILNSGYRLQNMIDTFMEMVASAFQSVSLGVSGGPRRREQGLTHTQREADGGRARKPSECATLTF